MQLELIHKENISRVLEKAKHYRTLNEPELAASICQDILAVDKNNQAALIVYILTLIDQIDNKTHINTIKDMILLLNSEYEKFYYQGLFFERKARFLLSNHMGSSFAYTSFSQALEYYYQAKDLASSDNDDAILRINSCIRTINKENLSERFDNIEYLE
jgi:hypothetical protein